MQIFRRLNGKARVQESWTSTSFFWMGCSRGNHGVGMLVAERWIEKVLACERETDGGEGDCREDFAELDFCILCAAGW